MSRTTRKRSISYEEFNFNPYIASSMLLYHDTVMSPYQYNLVESKKMKAKYYTDGFYTHVSLPRWFRKQVTKERRNRDKRSLYIDINYDVDMLYCSWNCKTNNHWDYY